MNLQAFTIGLIAAVNPQTPANLYFSTGPGPTQADGSRVPTYSQPSFIAAQVQPIGTGDQRKLDALNIQGVNNKIYISGQLRGMERVNRLGGDLVVLDDGETWLVKAVLEDWNKAGWCSVACVLQNDARVPYVQRPRF